MGLTIWSRETALFDWITGFTLEAGYLGIGVLMFLENVVPPIPSELVMPLAGYSASRGEVGILGVIVAGSFGSIAGTSLWYVVALKLGKCRLKSWAVRHGRLLTLSPDDIDGACRWFSRHGEILVFLGRLVPVFRSVISLPAGFASMRAGRFLLFTALGSFVWTSVLTIAGYYLGENYERLSGILNPVSNVVMTAIVVWYGYRVATFGRSRG